MSQPGIFSPATRKEIFSEGSGSQPRIGTQTKPRLHPAGKSSDGHSLKRVQPNWSGREATHTNAMDLSCHADDDSCKEFRLFSASPSLLVMGALITGFEPRPPPASLLEFLPRLWLHSDTTRYIFAAVRHPRDTSPLQNTFHAVPVLGRLS